jgi:hypothetical protein
VRIAIGEEFLLVGALRRGARNGIKSSWFAI